MINTKIADLAIQLAALSEHSTRVGAVITNGKHVITTGVNSKYKSHPLQKYYNDRYRNFNVPIHNNIHAELDAILKYQRMKIHSNKLQIYIARLNKANQLQPAKPCPACRAAIIDNKINTIIYSNLEGFDYELY